MEAADLELLREILELTLAMLDALQTVCRMRCKHKLEELPAGPPKPRCIGFDPHAVPYHRLACAFWRSLSFDLDHAHAAGAEGLQVLVMAERGNGDAHGLSRLQRSRAIRDLD